MRRLTKPLRLSTEVSKPRQTPCQESQHVSLLNQTQQLRRSRRKARVARAIKEAREAKVASRNSQPRRLQNRRSRRRPSLRLLQPVERSRTLRLPRSRLRWPTQFGSEAKVQHKLIMTRSKASKVHPTLKQTQSPSPGSTSFKNSLQLQEAPGQQVLRPAAASRMEASKLKAERETKAARVASKRRRRKKMSSTSSAQTMKTTQRRKQPSRRRQQRPRRREASPSLSPNPS